MNSGLTAHQQQGHTEMESRFKASSERPEKCQREERGRRSSSLSSSLLHRLDMIKHCLNYRKIHKLSSHPSADVFNLQEFANNENHIPLKENTWTEVTLQTMQTQIIILLKCSVSLIQRLISEIANSNFVMYFVTL